MASVNEQLVQCYLESLGFLLRQPRKYQVIARGKAPFEEADWLGVNPAMPEFRAALGRRPAPGLWGAAELARVPGVAVAVRGWHTDRFTAVMLENSPEIWRFAEPEAMGAASAALGLERPAPVLFLADLPPSPEERAAALEVLARHGVEGVVPFRTMLLDLLDRVDVKRSYEKSDVLQTLRILKAHRLTRTRQMTLEDVVRTRRRAGAGTARGPGAGAKGETGELALGGGDEDEKTENIEEIGNVGGAEAGDAGAGGGAGNEDVAPPLEEEEPVEEAAREESAEWKEACGAHILLNAESGEGDGAGNGAGNGDVAPPGAEAEQVEEAAREESAE